MLRLKSVMAMMLIGIGSSCLPTKEPDSLIERNPSLQIGSDIDNMADRKGVYKTINNYFVDSQGNVFIADIVDVQVDKYDFLGNYKESIGSRGQGPGEFQYISCFVVTSEGNLCAQGPDFRLSYLDASGNFIKSIELPEPYRTSYCADIEIDSKDRIYMVIVTIEGSCLLQLIDDHFKVIHMDKKKTLLDGTRASFLPIVKPDIAVDDSDHIYVLDSIYYKVYKYDNDGKLIMTYERKDKPQKMDRSDFVFVIGAETIDARKQFNDAMSDLDGWNQYMPTLFGINIDETNIYLWTSEMKADGRYVVDIYDLEFRFRGKVLCYNWLIDNKIRIRDKKVYMPNISPQGPIKGGRFSFHVMPYKLEVYNLKWSTHR